MKPEGRAAGRARLTCCCRRLASLGAMLGVRSWKAATRCAGVSGGGGARPAAPPPAAAPSAPVMAGAAPALLVLKGLKRLRNRA